MIRTLFTDAGYGLRVLGRSPSFAIGVIAVLALGIGANTAIFSIVNAVLLRPLPYEQADRVVRLFHVPPQDAFPGIPRFAVSPANFYDWKRDAQTFESMAIYRIRRFRLTEGGNAEAIIAGAVGADLFQVFRARPAMGRVFLPEEDVPGRSRVVILSDGFWRTRLGAAADVIGRSLMLDGEAYTIVGVMPARFSVAVRDVMGTVIWVPLAYDDAARAVRENHNAAVVARLKPGVDVQQAQSEMEAISTRLERDFPKENAGWGATVVPLQEAMVGEIQTTLVMLLGAVGLVLLIACANVGNLLFTRALGRRKEIAIRAAIGAGRARVFQQFLVEAMVLAMAGGAAGLLLGQASLAAAATLLTGRIPRANEISIDTPVLLFAASASVLAGILAGALPALRAGRSNLTDVLKEGGRDDSALGIHTRRLLVVGEVALSVMLLMGAGVMLRSLMELRSVDAGFDPQNVLTMQVSLPEIRYARPAQASAFFDTAIERISALPGVEAAGTIDDLPLSGLGGSVQPIVLEGRAELLPRDQPTVAVRKISPGYLRTMNIPVLRGRNVEESDSEVILVSQSAVRLLWGDADPIGRRITLPLQSRTLLKTVVGIVGEVKQGDLSEAETPTVYEYTRERDERSLFLAVRTSVPPLSLAQPVAAVVRGMDKEQPVENVRTMEAALSETLSSQRLSATLLGIFASVALVLASVGIYSVLSYVVRGRRREIGIRTALGAQTADVLRLVVVEGMKPAIGGIAAGAFAALASARVLETLVFGVSPSDPLTLVAVAGALAIVALVASLVPAYRATQVDSLTVLREN